MRATSLLFSLTAASLLLLVACGGSVSTVDDGNHTPSSSPTTKTPGQSPPSGSPSSGQPTPFLPAPTTEPANIPPIDASSYDQTCNVDGDCIGIVQQADCGCACPNAAINKSSVTKWQADVDAHNKACVESHAPACGADCAAPHVFCDNTTSSVGACRLTYP